MPHSHATYSCHMQMPHRYICHIQMPHRYICHIHIPHTHATYTGIYFHVCIFLGSCANSCFSCFQTFRNNALLHIINSCMCTPVPWLDSNPRKLCWNVTSNIENLKNAKNLFRVTWSGIFTHIVLSHNLVGILSDYVNFRRGIGTAGKR
jgi:hypothetical protein